MMKRTLICFLMLLFIFGSCLRVSAADTEELLIDEGPAIEEYDFAMVFIPDFQVVTNSYSCVSCLTPCLSRLFLLPNHRGK